MPSVDSVSRRKSLSSKRMKELEDQGQSLGVPKLSMMENAGASVASYVKELLDSVDSLKKGKKKYSEKKEKKIVAIAGTGNNGGDVFVAARHLLYWRFKISLILLGSELDIRAEEAKTNWDVIKRLPKIKKVVVDDLQRLKLLRDEISDARVLVVGIFGTGFRGKPRELQMRAIEDINGAVGPLKVSVDLPSGMECDTGVSRYAVESDSTITMHAPKRGMVKNPEPAGRILVANIGLPF